MHKSDVYLMLKPESVYFWNKNETSKFKWKYTTKLLKRKNHNT